VTASERGFSILELLTAMAIMLAATAGVFTLMMPSHGTLAAQSEASDMQQRLRVGVDAVTKGVLAAATLSASVAPIRPYRVGAVRPDPPDTFKSDTISVLSAPLAPGVLQSATYWQQSDTGAATFQLMFYDGSPAGADVPVVDHVVSLAFEYFGDPRPPTSTAPLEESTCLFEAGDPPTPRLAVLGDGPELIALTAAQLTDGPWCPDAASSDRWDADLLRIRRVAATLRVEAAAASLRGPASALFMRGGTSRGGHSWVPDIEVHFDVSPRNMNRGR